MQYFTHEGKSSTHSAVDRRENKKLINLDMAIADKGPTQGKEEFSTVSDSHVYSYRIVNCRDRGTMSQYGTPSHVWKHLLGLGVRVRGWLGVRVG